MKITVEVKREVGDIISITRQVEKGGDSNDPIVMSTTLLIVEFLNMIIAQAESGMGHSDMLDKQSLH